MASKSALDEATCCKLLRSVVTEVSEQKHLQGSTEAIAVSFAAFFLGVAACSPRLNASTLEKSLPRVVEGLSSQEAKCVSRQLTLAFSWLKVTEKSYVTGAKTHAELVPVILALRKWRCAGATASPPEKGLQRAQSSRSQNLSPAGQDDSQEKQAAQGVSPQERSDHAEEKQRDQVEEMQRDQVEEKQRDPGETFTNFQEGGSSGSAGGSNILGMYGLADDQEPDPEIAMMLQYQEDVEEVLSVSSGSAVQEASTAAVPRSESFNAQADSSTQVSKMSASDPGYAHLPSMTWRVTHAGSSQAFQLEEGSSGFCVAKLPWGSQETEVPNSLLRTFKRPAAPVMKRPLSATAVLRKPSTGSVSGDSAAPISPHENASPAPDLISMYYKSQHAAALRIPKGKQVLSISAARYRTQVSKGDLMGIINEAKDQLSTGISTSDAKAWALKRLAEVAAEQA